jgi:hypothetical protein
MRALRLLLIYVGFVVVLSQAFPLTNYQAVLPADMFVYPRSTTSGAQYLTLSLIFTWLVPAAVVALLMWVRKGLNWQVVNAKVLVLATCIYLGTWVLRLAAALVPGGGGLYTVNVLLAYVGLPLKVALFVGAVVTLIDVGNRSVRRADA